MRGTICMKRVRAFVATFALGSFDCLAKTSITLVLNRYWLIYEGNFFAIAAIFDKAVCRVFHSVVSQESRSSSTSSNYLGKERIFFLFKGDSYIFFSDCGSLFVVMEATEGSLTISFRDYFKGSFIFESIAFTQSFFFNFYRIDDGISLVTFPDLSWSKSFDNIFLERSLI